MEDLKAFGRNVRAYRKRLHLSQEVLSEKLGINPSNITKIENGEQFVTAPVLYKLAEILQVSVSDLFKTKPVKDTSQEDNCKQKLMKYVSTLSENEAKYVFENIKLFQKYAKTKDRLV